MALHESLRGLAGPRRLPLTGAFLHDNAARARKMAVSRSRFQARDLFSLLLRHFAARRSEPEPRCYIRLNVIAPSGRPSVRIVGQKRETVPVAAAPVRAQQRG
jgi:hypothetical protein